MRFIFVILGILSLCSCYRAPHQVDVSHVIPQTQLAPTAKASDTAAVSHKKE